MQIAHHHAFRECLLRACLLSAVALCREVRASEDRWGGGVYSSCWREVLLDGEEVAAWIVPQGSHPAWAWLLKPAQTPTSWEEWLRTLLPLPLWGPSPIPTPPDSILIPPHSWFLYLEKKKHFSMSSLFRHALSSTLQGSSCTQPYFFFFKSILSFIYF